MLAGDCLRTDLPVALMERLLPRHMQIIYLINWMHLEEQGKQGRGSAEKLAAVSRFGTIGGIDKANGWGLIGKLE